MLVEGATVDRRFDLLLKKNAFFIFFEYFFSGRILRITCKPFESDAVSLLVLAVCQ